jgi:hypothetical protein
MSRYPDERSGRGVLVRRRERGGVKEGALSAECVFIVLAPSLFPLLARHMAPRPPPRVLLSHDLSYSPPPHYLYLPFPSLLDLVTRC